MNDESEVNRDGFTEPLAYTTQQHPYRPEQTMCDHGDHLVHRDGNGWWVGTDDTSDCPDSDRGHEVEGSPR